MSIDDFLKIDLEQEHDPPCFLEAKKKAKHPPQSTVRIIYNARLHSLHMSVSRSKCFSGQATCIGFDDYTVHICIYDWKLY